MVSLPGEVSSSVVPCLGSMGITSGLALHLTLRKNLIVVPVFSRADIMVLPSFNTPAMRNDSISRPLYCTPDCICWTLTMPCLKKCPVADLIPRIKKYDDKR